MQKWIARALMRVTAARRVREIRLKGAPYIERYFICRLFGVTVYLHRYRDRDGDRDLHDHPWRWAIGLPLVGGYQERVLRWLDPKLGPVTRTRRIGWLRPNIVTAQRFHQIVDVDIGTWTLFIHGPRVKAWGFLRTEPNVHMETDDGGEYLGPVIEYYQPLDTSTHRGWTRHGLRGRDLPNRRVSRRSA